MPLMICLNLVTWLLLESHGESAESNSDNDLIAGIRHGDEKAFELLFRKYFRPLLQFGIRYLGNRESAEDVVQTVFLNIWRSHSAFNPKHTLKAYLYAAVKNQCLKKIRHANVEKEYRVGNTFLESDQSNPENELLRKELEARIHAAIRSLPEKCRIIFCMNRFDGLTYREIAVIQELSLSTVETQMVRALKHLRKILLN